MLVCAFCQMYPQGIVIFFANTQAVHFFDHFEIVEFVGFILMLIRLFQQRSIMKYNRERKV